MEVNNFFQLYCNVGLKNSPIVACRRLPCWSRRISRNSTEWPYFLFKINDVFSGFYDFHFRHFESFIGHL